MGWHAGMQGRETTLTVLPDRVSPPIQIDAAIWQLHSVLSQTCQRMMLRIVTLTARVAKITMADRTVPRVVVRTQVNTGQWRCDSPLSRAALVT